MTHITFAPSIARVWVAMLGLSLVAAANSQDLRDPTIAPSAARIEPVSPAPSSWGGEGGVSVIVRDGRAGLVVGTRVVQPGQKVGRFTLERITETEVWLRDGSVLRKVARFGGIQRYDPAVAAMCPPPASAQTHTKARSGKTPKPVTAAQASPASTKVDPQCDAPLSRSSKP